MSDKKYSNKLINETSPYLLQHAHNPVDWYPWGQEAFGKAKNEDKPIFLSIGYSTCHWCHVMAHESFEDEEAAKVLNDGFICVKVDREERPDIDEVYMNVCQAMTGSGGWPLTIFMTADKKPFFAGTYFPKNTAFGRTGLIELLNNISAIWKTDKHSLTQNSDKIQELLTQTEKTEQKTFDTEEIIKKGFAHLSGLYEKKYGGFSYSPKFPMPHYLLFLLKYWKAYNSGEALYMAQETLKHMYRGGIFDHVGYGFSRYSTDNKWLVPHFEKMLYDNAGLLLAYSECYAVSGNPDFRDIIIKICTYVLRDMQSPEGAFYSAEDADSDGEEGKFYVFDYAELKGMLSKEDIEYLAENYGLTENGNFEDKNILNKIGSSIKDSAAGDAVIKKLYDIRQKRIRPFKDTKISASWNGLMIQALARAGVVLKEKKYIQSAEKAADFIIDNMTDNNGLYGIYKDGKKSSGGFLADYANMANALIAVYQATFHGKYLKAASNIAKNMIVSFWDEKEKRFYMSKKNEQELFMRPKDEYDGAMPSGNACAVMCLVTLANLTGDENFRQTADSAMGAFLPKVNSAPGAYVHLLSAFIIKSRPHRQIIIAADKKDEKAREVHRNILSRFLPFSTVIFYDKSTESKSLFPELSEYNTDSPFAGYVCENFACKKPVFSYKDLLRELDIYTFN